jgi:predicted transcriptional regulator
MEQNKGIAKTKSAKQMERHLKGIANHHRIEILLLIAESGGITLEDIVKTLKANEKTIGEHTRRLNQAGLVNKKYRGKFVEHTLSPYGRIFVRFLKSFQSI